METKELETNRLILRKIKEDDYKDAYNKWCCDPEVTRYVTWNIHENENVTKEYFNSIIEKYKENKIYNWIIELKETHEIIGNLDIGGVY